VPDVASISAATGIPLVYDVLNVAGIPALLISPDVVGFSAVDFIPAIDDISAIAVFPAVDGVFAVASFPAYIWIPMLLLLVSLHTVLYNETYIGRQTMGLRLSDCHFAIELLYYRISDWRI
jgi:hypothetical protein